MSQRFAWNVVILLAVGCRREAPEPPEEPVTVHCQKPVRGPIAESVSLRGRITPPPGGSAAIAAQVPGRIAQVLVREGQHVSPGDVIATIDDISAGDVLKQAEASLAQARAARANAEATFNRTRALVERGIAARQELEDSEAKAQGAQAGVASATAAVDLARRTVGRIQVRSSIDAVITHIVRGAGSLVDGTPSTPIAEVSSSTAIEFSGAATQWELGRLAIGQAATGKLVGDTPIQGKIRALPSALDPSTGLGGVRVALESVGPEAPVGAFGRMTVETERHEGALLVPRAALRGALADGAQVVLCKAGKAAVVDIGVGLADEHNIEVLRGVGEADLVATDHVLGLETDTPIREAK